ncbi:MAG: glutamyl-tRNA reductase [Crocinitomicaceae bacterium]|nr:glutamyl-tRNA reductase [Crocinitomicaceae bacterium]
MTKEVLEDRIFVEVIDDKGIDTLHIVAFTHRNLSVNEVGELHIEDENQQARLTYLKGVMQLDEIMFLSTCNRVEFVFTTSQPVTIDFLNRFFHELYPTFGTEQEQRFSSAGYVFSGIEAVQHMLSVASSVDSMIVGEREIITQVRNAFEACRKMELTGDLIRLLMRQTIQTAKKVYTETSIAKKPVSVVSLAYHKLRDMNVPLDSRILIVGAGMTNTNMSRFLRKHGFTNFNVFNRTFEKAENLASDLNGTAHPLSSLNSFTDGFDIIITCTGSEHHILTPEIYTNLLQGEASRKVVIDIAIPQDLSPKIIADHNVTHISVEVLQKISNENLKARSQEIQHVEEIIAEALFDFKHLQHERAVELAMRSVPNKVKEIRSTAVNEVFAQELGSMDDASRETLEKVIGYMEKKYMSMPMLMAKEILLKKHS